MVHVVEINSLAQLDGYRLAWRQLLGNTRRGSFFQSLDWLEPYWRNFGQEQRLRVLVVKGSQGTIGILPLVLKTEATRFGAVRVLTYPLAASATFYAPLGPNPTATLIAGLSHIRRTQRDWDLVDFRGVYRHGTDFGRTEHSLRGLGYQAYEQPWAATAIIEMADGWPSYESSREPAWREAIAHATERLSRAFQVNYVRYRPAGAAYEDDDPRWDLYHACQRLAKSDTQHGGVPSDSREYDREIHEAATAAGALDLNVLLLDGQISAFIYGYHTYGYVSVLASGCAPGEFADAAQDVLLSRMIVDGFARNDRAIDFGQAEGRRLAAWQTARAISYRYTHFAPTARAQALRMSWLARNVAGLLRIPSQWAKKLSRAG